MFDDNHYNPLLEFINNTDEQVEGGYSKRYKNTVPRFNQQNKSLEPQDLKVSRNRMFSKKTSASTSGVVIISNTQNIPNIPNIPNTPNTPNTDFKTQNSPAPITSVSKSTQKNGELETGSARIHIVMYSDGFNLLV